MFTTRIVPEILGQTFLYLGLLVKAPYNKVFFILLCGVCIYTLHYIPPRVSLQDYFLTTAAFARACDGLDYLIIRDAQHVLRYKDQTTPASELPFWQRAKWALVLIFSPRGIGWKHMNANTIPRHTPIKSRTFFIFNTLLQIIVHSIVFVVICLQISRNPVCGKGSPRLVDLPWTWRFHGIFALIILIYVVMQLQYLFLCLFLVVCGLFAPEDCPPLFGSVIECYNVRRIWGRAWHQLLRRPYLSIGVMLGQGILRLELGSVPSGMILVVVSFFTTGALHYFGDRVVLGGPGSGSLRFFGLQGVAIFAEVIIEELVRNWFDSGSGLKISSNGAPSSDLKATRARVEVKYRYRPPRRKNKVPLFLRLFGYLYVVSWIYFTMPIFLDPVLSTGVLEEDGKRLKNLVFVRS